MGGAGQTWANKDAVLGWVSASADPFRRSSLPGKGIRLYVNVVETIFYGCDAGFAREAPGWWYNTFSEVERRTWAVMDRHRYWAWDAQSSGCTVGPPKCGWRCTDWFDTIRWKLSQTINSYVEGFFAGFPDGLKAVSELSV